MSEDILINNQQISKNIIRLLTYNFFLRPPPIKTNQDDYKDERLRDFIEILPSFDIICLQEAFGAFSNRKQDLINNAKQLGINYYSSSNMPSFFSKFLIDGGLLVLSRYPILDCQKITFDYGLLSDGLSMKGAIYTKIKPCTNNYIHIFTTHLQASYIDSGNDFWKKCIETRANQSETLINFIYTNICRISPYERERSLFILCGDFNMDGNNYKEYKSKYNIEINKQSEIEIFIKKLEKLGKIRNLNLEKYKEYQSTYGNNISPYDQVLTDPCDINSNQTIDYIFEIIPDFNMDIYSQIKNTDDSNSYKSLQSLSNTSIQNTENISNIDIDKKIYINIDSTNIEPFIIKNRPYQQLSDHFGISTEIVLK